MAKTINKAMVESFHPLILLYIKIAIMLSIARNTPPTIARSPIKLVRPDV